MVIAQMEIMEINCSDIEWASNGPGTTSYCGSISVCVEGDIWDADLLGCALPPFDCNAIEANCRTISPSSTNPAGVSYTVGSSGSNCWGQLYYDVGSSGSYPGNANAGGISNDGGTCNAYAQGPTNDDGADWVNNHTMDCGGDPWYRYYLTAASRRYLRFTGVKESGFLTAWTSVDEVRYSATGNCNSTCNLSDGGGGGDFEVVSPQPGYYYVRITENLGNITLFDIDTDLGPTKIAYDDICGANYLSSSVGLGYNTTWARNNIGATDEDFCTVDEPYENDNRTVWFKFLTGSSIGSQLSVYVENAGGDNMTPDIAVFKGPSTISCATQYNFSSLTHVGDDDGDFGLFDNDAEVILSQCNGTYTANTYYYVQVDDEGNTLGIGYNDGNFNIRLQDNNHAEGPDNICSALFLGNLNGTTASDAINNQSNYCAGTQGGEPGGGQKTVWYYFTTGSTVGYDFNINMNAESDGLNADIYVYEACSGCAFGGLTEMDNFWADGVIPLCIGTCDAGGTISGKIKPNSTYYIRADGVSVLGTEGQFDISYNFSGGGYNGNDLFCNATDLGTLSNGGTLSQNNFNNYNAGAEENCALDEPGGIDADDETVWFKFTTSANPDASIDIDVTADGGTGQGGVACLFGEIVAGWVKVYEETGTIVCPFTSGTNGFSQIAEPSEVSTGIDVSDVKLTCPKASTTYWVQVETGGLATCDQAQFDLVISGDSYEQGPDDACDAVSLGTLNIGGSLSKNDFSNYCATDETGEHNTSGSDETVWYKFTTGANSGVRFDVDVDAEFASGLGGVCILGEISAGWVRIYQSTGGSCTFGNLTQVGENNDITTITQDHWFVDCPEPSTTYFIQIETGGLSTCDEAKFDVDITMDAQPKPTNDDLCDAFDLGTLNNQATINAYTLNGNTNFTTFCSSKQTGEPKVNHGEPDVDEEGSVWFKFKPAGTLGGNAVIGAMTEIWAEFEGEEGLTEWLQVNLFEDPANCGTLTDLIEQDNKEDEEYYTPEALLIDDCLDADLIGDCNERTRIYGCLEPGKTYSVQVFVKEITIPCVDVTDLGLTDERAHFNLFIRNSRTVPNTNDDFVDAKLIPAITGSAAPQNMSYPAASLMANENNLCATVEGWEFATATPEIPELDHTVWYRFIAPASGSVQFRIEDAVGSTDPEKSIEEQLTIFQYSGVGTPGSGDILMEYNADDDFLFGEDGDITWDDYVFVTCLTPGNTYFARIDGALDGTGYCAETEFLDGDEMRGVFDLRARDYDIWEGSDLVCNSGIGTAADITSSANQTVGDLATWNTCGTEVTIDLDYLSNYCANNLQEIINPWDAVPEKTMWYSFIAPATGMVTIDGINKISCIDPTRAGRAPFIDIRLACYDLLDGFVCTDMSSNPASFQLMGESESDGIFDINCIGLDEELEIDCLVPGRRYYIVVDGKARTGNPDGKFGEFKLEMTNTIKNILGFNVRDLWQPASNNAVCDAIALGDPTGGGVDTDVNNTTYPSPARSCNNSENTYCATNSGDPAINGFTFWGTDNSVWYTFTAPTSGAVEIYVDGDVHGNSDQLSPQIAVFEPKSQSNPCPVADSLFDIFAGPAISTGFSTTYNSGVINCLEPG